MIYFFAFLVFLFFGLVSQLLGFLGIFLVIIYSYLGFIFGANSIILGISGLIGSVYCISSVNGYIKTYGAISNAPRISYLSSMFYVFSFLITLFIERILGISLSSVNHVYLFGGLGVGLIMFWLYSLKNRKNSLDSFNNSVVSYKVIEKYSSDPKWATYLYFGNGEEGWNQTIPGSFLAKDSVDDLTFVHNTKSEAIYYANRIFRHAKEIEE